MPTEMSSDKPTPEEIAAAIERFAEGFDQKRNWMDARNDRMLSPLGQTWAIVDDRYHAHTEGVGGFHKTLHALWYFTVSPAFDDDDTDPPPIYDEVQAEAFDEFQQRHPLEVLYAFCELFEEPKSTDTEHRQETIARQE